MKSGIVWWMLSAVVPMMMLATTADGLLTVKLDISLIECIKEIPGISHYYEQCDSVGLQKLLRGGTRGYTVIAATNDGFAKESESLMQLGAYDRTQYIRNTIVEGKYTTQSLAHFAYGNGEYNLRTTADYPLVCHAHRGGAYTVNGGLVIKQYIALDGVLIIVDKFFHHYDEPLVVSLSLDLVNTELAAIVENTVDKLKRNGYKFNDCTLTIPPETVIAHLEVKPELLLHYVFDKCYYPIDFKYLVSVTSYAGIVYNVDYTCNSDVRIGRHAGCDLAAYRVSNEGVVYPAKKGLQTTDLRALGLDDAVQIAFLKP